MSLVALHHDEDLGVLLEELVVALGDQRDVEIAAGAADVPENPENGPALEHGAHAEPLLESGIELEIRESVSGFDPCHVILLSCVF